MNDISSPYHLEEFGLGRIVYYGLPLKLYDHYSCYELLLKTFIKKVDACAFCLSIFINIQLPSPKWVFPSLQMYRYTTVYY